MKQYHYHTEKKQRHSGLCLMILHIFILTKKDIKHRFGMSKFPDNLKLKIMEHTIIFESHRDERFVAIKRTII